MKEQVTNVMCAQTDRERQCERTRSSAPKVRSEWVTVCSSWLCCHPSAPRCAPDLAAAEMLGNKLRSLELPCARSMADVRAPRAGRQYRVARAGETEYRRVTDHYHNHTSPLIASTCWIKHSAFLPRAVTPSKLIQVHFTHSEKRKRRERWNGKIH